MNVGDTVYYTLDELICTISAVIKDGVYHLSRPDTFIDCVKEEMLIPINPGDKWQHKKGGLYEIICGGLHSETKESLIVYKSVNTGDVWIRPASMFMDGKFKPYGGGSDPKSQ